MYSITTISGRLMNIGLTFLALLASANLAIAQNEGATATPEPMSTPTDQSAPKHPSFRPSLTCREAATETEHFERRMLAESKPKVRRMVTKARHFLVFAEYSRHFCYDQSDHEDVSRASLRYLDKAIAVEPENPYLLFLMGVVNYEMHNHDTARAYFEKAYLLKHDWDAKFHFYYARTLHQADRYAEALRHYNWARAKGIPYNNLDDDLKLRAAQCENGLRLHSQEEGVTVENLGPNVNSQYGEYSSAVNASNTVLYFTVRGPGPMCQQGKRGAKKKKNPYQDFISMYLERVYRAERDSASQEWGCPALMPKPINQERYDNAPCQASFTGDTLYTYQRKYGRNGSTGDRGNIYMYYKAGSAQAAAGSPPGPEPAPNAKKRFGKWVKGPSLGDINSNEHESHLSISPDGKYVIFESDRPGGAGGYDLYIAYNNGSGSFTGAQNLGRTVNTSADERAPFVNWDSLTVYFSSNGHNSIGGFDVFMTKPQGNGWATPQNLGVPLNSAEDDIYFHLLPDRKTGYMTSSRSGGRGYMDIYFFSAPEDKLKYQEQSQEELVAAANKLEANATPVNLANLTVEPTPDTLPADTTPTTFRDIETEVTSIGMVNFPFDKYSFTQNAISRLKTEILPAVRNNPDKKVVLLGHTDPFGSADYNERLSKNRVEAVRQWLISNGVPANRIETYHHGEDRLILENSQDKHANEINRRVEVFLH